MSTNEYGPWQCCRWHRTGGSGLRICNDRDARSLTGEPMPPFALFAPSPTLRTYEQGVADERAAVVAWLREVHAKYRSTKVGITSYGSVAQDIERGSHRADSEAAEVNHGQRDDGAQAQPAGAAAAPTGQAGGEQSSPAGPPAGLRCNDCGDPAACVGRVAGGAPVLACVSCCPQLHLTGACSPCAGSPAGPRYCTGAEFVAAAQAVIKPLTDQEIAEMTGLVLEVDPALPDTDFISFSVLPAQGAGKELLRVLAGVTPAELREAGFPDVAARLEGGGRG